MNWWGSESTKLPDLPERKDWWGSEPCPKTWWTASEIPPREEDSALARIADELTKIRQALERR
jgi:hypothetical protein